MAIQTLHDTGDTYQITPKYDGGVYATGISDCVCKGIGDEFAINYTGTSLDVSFNSGSEAVIGGSFFRIKSLEAVTLTPNATIYLCANIDLSRPNGQRGAFVQRTASNMMAENLNTSTGTTRDLLLYVITTSNTGVSSVVDKRIIKGDGNAVSGIGFVCLSRAEYDAIANKDNNTLYFITE